MQNAMRELVVSSMDSVPYTNDEEGRKEGAGEREDLVGLLMQKLHNEKRMKEDVAEEPVSWTELRKEALVVAAEKAGLKDTHEVASRVYEVWSDARHGVEQWLCHDCLGVLERLHRQGYIIGAITNGNCDIFRIQSLARFFSFAVAAEHVGVAKPHPLLFEEAMRQANHTDAAAWVHVGDNLMEDMWGAKRMGFQTVHTTEFASDVINSFVHRSRTNGPKPSIHKSRGDWKQQGDFFERGVQEREDVTLNCDGGVEEERRIVRSCMEKGGEVVAENVVDLRIGSLGQLESYLYQLRQ
eukprot:GHVS01040087.1.p1 GENE.GHVS01040087.1~~GHVS01040087.1.p1  ORF type:complete len:346 (-),score=66.55 GHVS01040087.1:87-977(-)